MQGEGVLFDEAAAAGPGPETAAVWIGEPLMRHPRARKR